MRYSELVRRCLLSFVIAKCVGLQARKYHQRQVYPKNCTLFLLRPPLIGMTVYRHDLRSWNCLNETFVRFARHRLRLVRRHSSRSRMRSRLIRRAAVTHHRNYWKIV